MTEPCCKGVESGYVDPNGVKFLMCNDSCTCNDCKEQRENEFMAVCPACGSAIDYCQGHGEIGDPSGFAILRMHDNEDHSECDPSAECEV